MNFIIKRDLVETAEFAWTTGVRGSRRLRCVCGGSLTCGSLGGFVEPNQIFPRINNLTIQTRNTVLSKQLLVPKRGKKKDQHFLYPVNHLNQRKSPSAPLVSQEIETDFFRRRFSRSREEFPKLRALV